MGDFISLFHILPISAADFCSVHARRDLLAKTNRLDIGQPPKRMRVYCSALAVDEIQ
jgi:hypothetical protein